MSVTENVMGGVIVMFIFLVAGAIVIHNLTGHTVDKMELTKNKYLEEAYSSDFNALLQATEPTTMRSFSDLLTDALYYRQDNLTFGSTTINTREFFTSTLDAAIGEGRYYMEIKPKIIEVSLNFVIDGSNSLQDEREQLAKELPGIIEGVKKKIYETGEEIVVANIYILGNRYDLKDRQKCDIYNTDRADITCYVIGAEELYAAPGDFNNETFDVNSKDQYKVEFNVTPPYSDVGYVRNIRKAGEKDYYEADWGAGVAYASAHNKGMAKLVVLFPVSDELSTSSIPDACFHISDIPRQKMCDLCSTDCPAERSSASIEKALQVAKTNGHIVNPIYSFTCDYDYKPMFNTYFEIVNGRSTSNVCSEPVCSGCSVNNGVCFHPDCESVILEQMNHVADETFGKVINLEDIQNLVYDISTTIDDNIEEYKFRLGEEYEYAARFVSERSLPLPNKLMTDAKLFIYPNKNEVA
ncbi:hypothetical protein GF343_04300 [Candidatus Woesearchaeota archaeon]|nr:hypothetical protein [Candidatus Woesearchaeota archaeon]